MDKRFDFQQLEPKIYARWQKSGYFNPDKLPKTHKKPFTIAIPPPNITGSLHLGHALNAAIQDILIRWQRMQGKKVLWLPGTDHAGIATQNVVEKELKKEGKRKQDVGREEFLKIVFDWKEKYGNIILDQLKKIGASCDWSRTRFTMDKQYQQAVTQAFIHYYNKRLIYKDKRLVHWCPRCATSLSDLEVDYKEETGFLWHIKYNVKSQKSKVKNYITVATTRPETMLGDAAIAVHPNDKRYKYLIGQMAILPILNREIPIIADKEIDPNFGTGAVKITPAHDELDFEIGLRHNLPQYEIINKNAQMMGEAEKFCPNLSVTECREKIIAELNKAGLLEKTENYTHRVGRCYRCDTILESLLSEQWFLKMKDLAQKALQEVKIKNIKFHPQKWEKLYINWLKNIKDWNISRQIWWGHQLPVWFCAQNQTGSQVKSSKLKVKSFGVAFGNDFIVSLNTPKKCPFCKNCQMVQETDVLDTWFSSALWPFATLGWPKKTKDLKTFYPTQTLSTARDIINLWVARMIFSGKEFMNKKPFTDVYIHATVLTKEGKRMSKSLGTGIDPLTLIAKYGADAVRFGLIWQELGSQDIRFDESSVLAGQKFVTKIWNASRFVLQQTNNTNIKTEIKRTAINKMKLNRQEKNILKELDQTKKIIEKNLESFKFGQALHNLYGFFWHSFCDKFIEEAKKSEREESKKILLYTLAESLKMLHPFMPFVTDELWTTLYSKKHFLMISRW